MTRVGINVEPLFQRVPSGVGVYTLSLLRGFGEIGRDVDVVLFHARHDRLASSIRDLPMERYELGLEREPLYRSWRELQRPAPQAVCGVLDVVHAPGAAVPPRGDAGLVVTVHDLAAFRFPDRYPREARVKLKRAALTAAREAALIICPSWSTALDVEALLDVEPARLRVVPHGVRHGIGGTVSEDETAQLVSEQGVSRPYLLWTGTQEQRKNVHAVLDAFSLVAPRRPDLTLVLHGPNGWLGSEVAEGLDRRGIRDRTVVSEGRLSRSRLTALYAGAELFVFPSLYEGFGLPVLEAMACGTPVVASNMSAVPECVGDAGILVDPLDHDALGAAIERVLDDRALAESLSESGQLRAAAFSWSESARRTWDVYEELVA